MTETFDKSWIAGIPIRSGRTVYPGLWNSFAQEKNQPWWQKHLFVITFLISLLLVVFFSIPLQWEPTVEDIYFSTEFFDLGDIRFRPKSQSTAIIEIDEVFGNQYVKKDKQKPLDVEEIQRMQRPEAEGIFEGEGDGFADAEDLAFLAGGVRPPKLLTQLKEYYPPEARSLGVNAELYLEIIIDREGVVRQVISYPDSVRIDKSLAPAVESRLKAEFQKAARKTLLRARYTPVVKNGTPIVVKMGIPFQFRITG